ncbi:MAG: NAD(P)H-dependent oxidoreductase [Prolixibacteraceae bacterium]
MKNILHVISSFNGEGSYSVKLGNRIIERIKGVYPDSQVAVKHLVEEEFPHLNKDVVGAFYTPVENRTDAQQKLLRVSDEAIQQIFDADIIVIGAPLYNFGISSALKAWIDHIARAGVTFRYTENGPEGLVKNKKVYIAMSSGGIYSSGRMQAYDFVSPYLRTVLGFLGMTDVEVVRAEGTSLATTKAEAVENALTLVTV